MTTIILDLKSRELLEEMREEEEIFKEELKVRKREKGAFTKNDIARILSKVSLEVAIGGIINAGLLKKSDLAQWIEEILEEMEPTEPLRSFLLFYFEGVTTWLELVKKFSTVFATIVFTYLEFLAKIPEVIEISIPTKDPTFEDWYLKRLPREDVLAEIDNLYKSVKLFTQSSKLSAYDSDRNHYYYRRGWSTHYRDGWRHAASWYLYRIEKFLKIKKV